MIDFDSAPPSRPKLSVIPGGRPALPAHDPLAGEVVDSLYRPREPREVDLSFLDRLNDRQREAVLITEGPLIVLAGAGSGKTSMLTSRIAYLIHSHRAFPSEILAMTFTNKAAQEMRERVHRVLAQTESGSATLGNPEIGTFHSVCVRILRQEMANLPFTKPFVIYDDSDQLSLIKGVCKKLDLDEKNFSPKSFQAAINRLKCDAVEAKDIDPSPHNLFEKKLVVVFEEYQKALVLNNALDFGEIICMVWRLFRDRPEVRARYQRRFRYIHVDEYQDTNRSQYLLLSALAGRDFGGHGNICVVGDEDQSIYKWRGADIRNILDFEKDYPGAAIVKLEQNYRSTQTIIKAAGHVIANNQQRKDKTLWTDNAEGDPITWYLVPDGRVEAETVVREIKRIAANEGRAYSDFSIFYRTNAQSRQFEDLFRRDKITYQIVGGLKFYDRKEIKDILAYFRVLLNPTDSISIKRIINTPARGIGKTTIDKLDDAADAAGISVWELLSQLAAGADLGITGAAGKKLIGFYQLIQRLMDFSAARPAKLLSEIYHAILDETRYVVELRQEATEESMARIENLEEFDTLIQEFEEEILGPLSDAERESRREGLLAEFLERSALASDADKAETMSSVKLMTLHSSKGLEFPVVFLVGMEEGLFPSVRPWEEESEEDIEEERRLAYVGMTRAREQLFLMSASARLTWGQVHFRDPSRFIQEIPESLVTKRDLTASARTSSAASGGGTGPTSSAGGGLSANWGSKFGPAAVSPFGSSGTSEWIGRKMIHPDYGRGVIIDAEGVGQERKVIVEFAGRDRRKFMLRYISEYLEDE